MGTMSITNTISIQGSKNIYHIATDKTDFLYAAIWGTKLISKIRISDFVEVATLEYPFSCFGNSWLGGFTIDNVRGFLYKLVLGDEYAPHQRNFWIVKIRLSDFSFVSVKEYDNTIAPRSDWFSTINIDTEANYLYVGDMDNNTSPYSGRVFKINANTLDVENVIYYDLTGKGIIWGIFITSAIDSANKVLFLTTDAELAEIVKVDLNTFSFAGSYQFDDFEAGAIAIDTADSHVYPTYDYLNLNNRATTVMMDYNLNVISQLRNEAWNPGDWVWQNNMSYEINNNFSYTASTRSGAAPNGKIVKFGKNPLTFVEALSIPYKYINVIDSDYNGNLFIALTGQAGVNLIKVDTGETVPRPQIQVSEKKQVLGNISNLGYTKRGAFINKKSSKGASFT